MNYTPMQSGMWALFAVPFRKNLTVVFGYNEKTARAVTKAAKTE